MERCAFHRDRGPSGLFSALSWLFEIFPDGLPQSQKRQSPSGTGGDVARSPIIAVTGLKTEAKLIAGPRVRTVSGGGDAAGLIRALEVAVANKVSAIISFGVAGGLKPGLAPGSKLVARSVITEDGGRYHGDPVWSQRLSVVLGDATIADKVGIDAPVVGHADKHALHIKTVRTWRRYGVPYRSPYRRRPLLPLFAWCRPGAPAIARTNRRWFILGKIQVSLDAGRHFPRL